MWLLNGDLEKLHGNGMLWEFLFLKQLEQSVLVPHQLGFQHVLDPNLKKHKWLALEKIIVCVCMIASVVL